MAWHWDSTEKLVNAYFGIVLQKYACFPECSEFRCTEHLMKFVPTKYGILHNEST